MSTTLIFARSSVRNMIGLACTAALAAAALPAQAATLTTLVSFDDSNGAGPFAGLIADAAGNLYGTTFQGGGGDVGTVFRLDPATATLTTIASFTGANGFNPEAGLIADAAGNLYGTTAVGGSGGDGTVFRIDPATGTLTMLVNFDGANGSFPTASLVIDAAGNFYGTTLAGGGSGNCGPASCGTVFRLDPATATLTTLVEFDGANGALPVAGLIADAAGNLYGTTSVGGRSDRGTVFKLDPVTSTLTTLVNFTGADGSNPEAGLIADSAGYLYGTTAFGGSGGGGTVFRLNPATARLKILANFTGANGNRPRAGLIADAAGYLYGTTAFGGNGSCGPPGCGTVFRLAPVAGTLSTLVNFDGENGANPYAGLIADAAGNLYGTTLAGGGSGNCGPASCGTVFRLSDVGFAVVPVPAPGALALFGLGAAALLARRRVNHNG